MQPQQMSPFLSGSSIIDVTQIIQSLIPPFFTEITSWKLPQKSMFLFPYTLRWCHLWTTLLYHYSRPSLNKFTVGKKSHMIYEKEWLDCHNLQYNFSKLNLIAKTSTIKNTQQIIRPKIIFERTINSSIHFSNKFKGL